MQKRERELAQEFMFNSQRHAKMVEKNERTKREIKERDERKAAQLKKEMEV